MMQSRARAHTARATPARKLALLTGLLGVGLGLVWSAWAWPFLVDDAFIVARYARRLAHGAGYTFQPGAASDGVTGPLWLVPLTLGARLGVDPVLVAKVLGLACGALAALLALRATRAAQGGRAGAIWLALLLGTAGPLWIWSVGGLETGAATCLATWLALSARARPAPRAIAVGVCGGLLAWLRPELAPWVGACLLVTWLRGRRAGVIACSLALLGALSVLGFRWRMFGHLLPLSAHAKPAVLRHGLEYLLETARAPGALVLLPWLLLGLVRGAPRLRLWSAGLALHGAAIILAGGDWMPGARLFVPLIPLACLLAAESIVACSRRQRVLVPVLAAAMLLVRAGATLRESTAARAAGALREARLPALLEALAPYPDPVVALDIGALGYVGERQLIDLGGLVEPRVAYAPGGHVAKRIDAGWLEARAPGAIVLHSRLPPRVDAAGHLRWFAGFPVERGVLAQAWVWTGFRVVEVVPYASDYFYVVLAKHGSHAESAR